MSSGLIYAVIVALWAVVLVPMWLRRHDEVTESRSVDRFQGAMRTLSRRASSAGDQREVLVPKRDRVRAVPDGATAQLSAASTAANRRRRTVLVLAGLTVLLAALGGSGLLPLWSALAPLVLLVGFLLRAGVRARRVRTRDLAARRAHAAALRRERQATLQDALDMDGTLRVPPRRAAAARRDEITEPARVAGGRVHAAAERAANVASQGSEQPAAAAGLYDAVAEHVWEPVPVPLPTYVLAAKAPRSVRVIDLTRPGHWTSGHLDADERAEFDQEVARSGERRPPREGDDIVTGEVLVERRYAVGD